MIRQSTKIKEKRVLTEFHRLLRSGKDFSTGYMYEEAGKVGFLSAKSAGDIVRKYYQKVIDQNKEMEGFVLDLDDTPHDVKINLFSQRFSMCDRESRLIIRYIKRNTILEKIK